MSDYTPSMEEVRERFIDGFPMDTWAVSREQCGRDFDRWLAAHDEQVRADTLRESREQAWRDGYYTGKRDYAGSIMGGMPMSTPNPYAPAPAEQKESKHV